MTKYYMKNLAVKYKKSINCEKKQQQKKHEKVNDVFNAAECRAG